MNARLVAIAGPLEGGDYSITQEISVGRERSNAISVEDRMLSRHHCLIRMEESEFRIRDLGSSNGTYVNGLPVVAHALKDGDQIRQDSLSLYLHTMRECHLYPVSR
jgi:pSer/pThr/pTyr-binding forkhead associated (FHA) protein